MATYTQEIEAVTALRAQNGETWNGVNPEYVARMRAQNRFHTGLDVARYCADIMRADMAAYDADSACYTQSLGCWHGFVAQQVIAGRPEPDGIRPLQPAQIDVQLNLVGRNIFSPRIRRVDAELWRAVALVYRDFQNQIALSQQPSAVRAPVFRSFFGFGFLRFRVIPFFRFQVARRLGMFVNRRRLDFQNHDRQYRAHRQDDQDG